MTDLDLLMKIMRGRRSVRQYTSEPVGDELIRRVVEAATLAPSAGNRQDWEFVVVTKHETKQSMARAVSDCWSQLLADSDDSGAAEGLRDYAKYFSWFSEAPVVIAVSTRKPDSFLTSLCGEVTPLVHGGVTSAALASQNLMLAAHVAGLGTCCLTGPIAASRNLSDILGLGNRRELVCLITLGHPAAESTPPERRPVSDVLRYTG